MGKLMGEHPELRTRAKEVSPLVNEVLAEVKRTSPEEWQKRLEAIAPELLVQLSEKKEPEKGLPALEGAEKGVVMRFAPNPNGPPTLGSARGIIVNSEYVKKYGGKFIIRFDDTDPVKKRPMPEAYGWYLEDCAWLGRRAGSGDHSQREGRPVLSHCRGADSLRRGICLRLRAGRLQRAQGPWAGVRAQRSERGAEPAALGADARRHPWRGRGGPAGQDRHAPQGPGHPGLACISYRHRLTPARRETSTASGRCSISSRLWRTTCSARPISSGARI